MQYPRLQSGNYRFVTFKLFFFGWLLLMLPGSLIHAQGNAPKDSKQNKQMTQQPQPSSNIEKTKSGLPKPSLPVLDHNKAESQRFVDRDGDGIQDGKEHRFYKKRQTVLEDVGSSSQETGSNNTAGQFRRRVGSQNKFQGRP